MITLGEALTRFSASSPQEGASLRLPLRQKKVARVRLSILGAVLQLTGERSLDDIAVREICEMAQVAPATFFNYFPNKEAVLVYYMWLWSIPITLQCRAVAAQETAFNAVSAVFDYTAREMEQNPRLMFEMITYIAQAHEPPQSPTISRAERFLAFPNLAGAEDVEPQSLDDLFTSLLQRARRAGELAPSLSIEAVALLLKTIFYGVPLATRRGGAPIVRRAYQEVLDILLAGLKHEERSDPHTADPVRTTDLD
ncbi:MAG TPA: TetR/AcrR family transcriptional regulator [Ktedonobacterales bacterium]|nr:TetR/AcrR family transcriptional regulator [Ktedonobacterales bacterium]